MACVYENSACDDRASRAAFGCGDGTSGHSHDDKPRRGDDACWCAAAAGSPYRCAAAAAAADDADAECGLECDGRAGLEDASSTLSSGCSDEVDSSDSPQIRHGDFIQMVSVASRVNDGVLISRDGDLTASGHICPQGATFGGDVKAFFHCHQFGPQASDEGDNRLYLLLPVARTAEGSFRCPVMDAEGQQDPAKRRVPALATVASDGGARRQLALKYVDPHDPDTEEATDCRWRFAPLSGNAFSRQWRVFADADGGRRVYAAADGAGRAFATEDDHQPLGVPTDGMENPQTFFYLYRKFRIREREEQ